MLSGRASGKAQAVTEKQDNHDMTEENEKKAGQETAQAAGAEEKAQETKETASGSRNKKQCKGEELKKKIAELDDKLSKEKEDYMRLMAEFETFRRRSAEEKLALVNNAAADTIKGMLPVLDDLERAMKMLATSSDEAAKEGTTLIYNKLMDYLKGRGLEIIDAKGKEFDTDFHEAVTQFPAPSEDLKGKVIDVLQTGYLLGGKILRYAKVVVGA